MKKKVTTIYLSLLYTKSIEYKMELYIQTVCRGITISI